MNPDFKPYKKCMLGGTFDRFHEGHKSLISTACFMAETIWVGIISEEWGKEVFSKKKHGERIESYEIRANSVKSFLKNRDCNSEIGPLFDAYGPAPDFEEADLMVVTAETVTTAHKINMMRKDKGFQELDIIVIPWLKNEDGKQVSSTLLREQEASKN